MGFYLHSSDDSRRVPKVGGEPRNLGVIDYGSRYVSGRDRAIGNLRQR